MDSFCNSTIMATHLNIDTHVTATEKDILDAVKNGELVVRVASRVVFRRPLMKVAHAGIGLKGGPQSWTHLTEPLRLPLDARITTATTHPCVRLVNFKDDGSAGRVYRPWKSPSEFIFYISPTAPRREDAGPTLADLETRYTAALDNIEVAPLGSQAWLDACRSAESLAQAINDWYERANPTPLA